MGCVWGGQEERIGALLAEADADRESARQLQEVRPHPPITCSMKMATFRMILCG